EDLPVLPPRRPESHKGSFGRVLLIGGSRGMAGSIALSAMAALRCGSGLVSAAVPDRILETVAGFDPAVMTIPLPDQHPGTFADTAFGKLQANFLDSGANSRSSVNSGSSASDGSGVNWNAIGIGPGMTTQGGGKQLLLGLLENTSMPLVIDADGLNVLSQALRHGLKPEGWDRVVLTPHAGEWERISGAAAGDRDKQVQAAEAFSRRSGATIVLKGAGTVVVRPNKRWVNPSGNPGMASGGTGDVLTGMITSLLGQGLGPWDAARLAVHHHGVAGDLLADRLGMPAVTASDLVREIRL
ncbi:MAG: NAD(P)H-hydrate dehydratase, partial [Planctomycetota bacterium]